MISGMVKFAEFWPRRHPLPRAIGGDTNLAVDQLNELLAPSTVYVAMRNYSASGNGMSVSVRDLGNWQCDDNRHFTDNQTLLADNALWRCGRKSAASFT